MMGNYEKRDVSLVVSSPNGSESAESYQIRNKGFQDIRCSNSKRYNYSSQQEIKEDEAGSNYVMNQYEKQNSFRVSQHYHLAKSHLDDNTYVNPHSMNFQSSASNSDPLQ